MPILYPYGIHTSELVKTKLQNFSHGNNCHDVPNQKNFIMHFHTSGLESNRDSRSCQYCERKTVQSISSPKFFPHIKFFLSKITNRHPNFKKCFHRFVELTISTSSCTAVMVKPSDVESYYLVSCMI